jgi:hypothetical protein
MTQALTTAQQGTQLAKIENVLINGDLSRLSEAERLSYYKNVCDSMGLNPLTKPFDYITLNGKLTLYARKDATEQLRKIHGVSIYEISKELLDDVFVVTAKARDRDGRDDAATGAVTVGNLKGEAKANAMMKAETKAKRRVTLSICGLGLLDETEVEDIPPRDKGNPPIIGTKRIVADEPGENDGLSDDGEWKFTFGQWNKRTVEQVYRDPKNGPKALKSYVEFLERSSNESKKPLSDAAKEAVEHIEKFLGALENEREPGSDG